MGQKLWAVFLPVTDGLSDLKQGMQLPWDPIKLTGESISLGRGEEEERVEKSIEVLSWKVLDTVK